MKLIIRAICLVRLIARSIKYILSEREDLDAEDENNETEIQEISDSGNEVVRINS